jgi:hypothetical protein
MAALESTPLILFSGLAADANIFVLQKIAFPHLIVPKWRLQSVTTLSTLTVTVLLTTCVRKTMQSLAGRHSAESSHFTSLNA